MFPGAPERRPSLSQLGREPLAQHVLLLSTEVTGDEFEVDPALLDFLVHAVHDYVLREKEERRRAWCHLRTYFFDEVVVDADIDERAGECARRGADRHAEQRD